MTIVNYVLRKLKRWVDGFQISSPSPEKKESDDLYTVGVFLVSLTRTSLNTWDVRIVKAPWPNVRCFFTVESWTAEHARDLAEPILYSIFELCVVMNTPGVQLRGVPN